MAPDAKTLRRMADELAAEVQHWEELVIELPARIKEGHRQMRVFRALADAAEAGLPIPKELILTPSTERTYIRDTMQVQSAAGRKVGRPIESDHPFAAWLKAQNITVTEWADRHIDPGTGRPYKRERVKSWFAEGAGARPAPRHAVDIIEAEATPEGAKKSAVPANKRTWKNGIRE